ncbi:MAG: hypothetical protein AAF716_02415 [Cyanobacteria bacterium P01_D01_bin.1]
MAIFRLRTIVSSLACASVALFGLVNPALSQDRTVLLEEDEATTVTGYFMKGEVISAECDSDCTDVDMYLYTELGVLVDSDVEYDDFPIVIAPYEGTFSIEITMPSCSHPVGCNAYVSSEFGF